MSADRKKTPYILLRVILVLVALPPIAFGLGSTVSGRYAAKYAAVLSRASITLTPELNYLLKPLGLYVLMFGVLMAYSIVDPVRHRSVITWGAAVLLLRALQRLVITQELHQLFNIPVWLNLLHCTYLFMVAFLLLALRPKLT